MKNKKIYSVYKNTKSSPQKIREVINKIKDMSIEDALNFLEFSTRKSSVFIKKTLLSAIANASNNYNIDIDNLEFFSIYANKAKSMKRIRARAKGRSDKIEKRNSHITIILKNKQFYIKQKTK